MSSRYRLVSLVDLLLILVFSCMFASNDGASFQALTTCYCLTQDVTYECTVSGGAFTVWSGSAFMCQGGEITLRHVGFLTAIGECNHNDGTIIARGVKTSNNHYTSQLTVRPLSHELIGRTITCSVDDGLNLITVGSGNLTVTTNPFPPPSEIYIIENNIGPTQVSFSWSAVPTNTGCPSFFYNISARNCGTCSPNNIITTSNSSICTNFSTTPFFTASVSDPCNFTVQSVICGNITGDMNYHLVTLAVPDALVVRNVPHYAFRTANLINLATSFQTVQSFNISNEQGIDGSATSYTITYVESPSGRICNSATIMASSCKAGICSYTFEVSRSACFSSSVITTTLFASNILGNGPNSSIVTGGRNTVVDVRFDTLTRTFSCSFQLMLMGRKSCIANVTYGNSCDQHLGTYPATDVGSTVITPIIEFIPEVSFYCISISASSGNHTVIVEGMLDLVNIGQQDIIIAAGVISPVVAIIIIVTMVLNVISVYQLYARKEIRTIKFTTSKTSSLTDVLQVFKKHGVSILSVNTHLHHTGVNLQTKPGFIDNYVFCICSKRQRDELKSEFKNIQFFEEHASNQELDDTALVKCTVKVSIKSSGSILETLGIFNMIGIEILGVNTPTGDNSVMCKCSKQEEKKILEDLKKLGTDSTDFSLKVVETHLKPLKSKTSTRRIEFLVRPEASDIRRVIKVFGDCGINITEVNPDYVKEFDSAAPRPEIVKAHNLVECTCKEEIRKVLLAQLGDNEASNVHYLPEEDLPSRNNVNHKYCVVAFSVIHEVGSLARALKAFEDLDINILGINTLGCVDLSTLHHHLNYKKCKVEFMSPINECQKELIKEIQAIGIVVETTPSLTAETNFLQLLIEDPEDEKSISMPKALQAVFTVFQKLDITITGYEMDCTANGMCQRQYQHIHVEYSCTNGEEEYQKLIKELTATGIVKVLEEFLVDDGNKQDLIQYSISCM